MNEFKGVLREIAEECRQDFDAIAEREGHRLDNSDSSEVVTEVDEEFTDTIMAVFEKQSEEFSFVSEELMRTAGPEERSNAEYAVIFDEIDGTGNMKDERGVFGPIIGIAEESNPCFGDVVACMFYDLSNDVIYEAYRGEGAFMNSEPMNLQASIPENKSKIRGLVDQAMLGKVSDLAEPLWEYHCKDFGSTGYSLALIASNRADFFVTGGHGYVKDKNTAEEIGPLYLLVEEAGGTVLDWDGKDLENQLIGMNEDKSHDYIAATSDEMAQKIVDDIQEYIT